MSKVIRWKYVKGKYNVPDAKNVRRTGSIIFSDTISDKGFWFFADVQSDFPGGEDLAKMVVKALNALMKLQKGKS